MEYAYPISFFKYLILLVQTIVTISGLHLPPDLEPRYIIKDHVTISGFSSGGLMAQTMQVAYSSFFQGVAVFSSTFYRCGPVSQNIKDFNDACTKSSGDEENAHPYDSNLVHEDIKHYMREGLIDDTHYLINKHLYVYVGLRSSMYNPLHSLQIIPVWDKYIKNGYKIKTRIQDAGYIMPIDTNNGENCTKDGKSLSFNIANCYLLGAAEALKFLYSDYFTIHHPPPMIRKSLQELKKFNQTLILEGITNHFMDEIGYYYIPTRCDIQEYPCLLHVFLHGCENARDTNEGSFIKNSGYLEVSEMNDIIMLFPQSLGCWDHFGKGGKYYATKKGGQVKAIWKIVQSIISGQSASAALARFIQLHERGHRHDIPSPLEIMRKQ